MSFRRGKYGIEYTPPPEEPERPVLLKTLGVAALIAVFSLAVTLFTRSRSSSSADETGETPPPVGAADAGPARGDAPRSESLAGDVTPMRVPLAERSATVRNLLMRLQAAEAARDVEMAATTIERLRALPGSPAADLDDSLARRLGALNLKRLFDIRSARWLVDVKVRSGDTAERIAAERGSTLASLRRLNGGNLSRLRPGQVLKVMNHPRFHLVVCRRLRTADLMLDDKFFRRYYLTDAVSGEEGVYRMKEGVRAFFAKKGVRLREPDLAELELLLLPRAVQVTIAEFG